jgi:HSP20 family molecular chaperone IbpA
LEIPLPAQIEAERVEAHYDRGLLHIVLPKHGETR